MNCMYNNVYNMGFFFTYADDISLLYPTYPYWNTKNVTDM